MSADSTDTQRLIPRHIAIIMDGNGRWAKKRFMPRVMGHKQGVDALEETVKNCHDLGVECLTVFAFSTENWRRPADEVGFLMSLFLKSLKKQILRLHNKNIRLRLIGRRDRLGDAICQSIEEAEQLTAHNTGMVFAIAVDYGGQTDIVAAANAAIASGKTVLTEEDIQSHLALNDMPMPDLFIRTGGETRISNFLLWQLAYSELYFTDTLWPDFNAAALNQAIDSFGQRERRFGQTSEQLPVEKQRG
ncbi:MULTISPECIES: isoprenyl transferase [Vitreoscilla]|uniref:Isoprenyl transferase n=1 Tax=Vitreoscilla stercoraria TaxID=61 RepID=A0ABY4EA04_VITST|nr:MULTISPECIES: isoprenyl transferase [Vitreoscilla]QJQ52116.1 ditrans,polycis-undecaprenyl-diphosphate synthase [Vitreoscilla sp. C1]UOO92143.1 isoprenyl transferase [Vitreoscilla stercoraria]